MTVANTTSRNQYTATSGQTVFPYTFEIFDKGDVVVLKNGTALSEGTNYTVSGVGNDNGGNITLTVGATAGDILTIYRDMAYQRTTDYQTSGDFLAQEVNDDFDRLWLAVQQNEQANDRAIVKPITDAASIDMTLPSAADRANSYLTFDATGAPSVVAAGDPSAPDAITRQDFTGDGSTIVYTLASAPGAAGAGVMIFIDGIQQDKDSYTITGTTLTFSEAPPLNSNINLVQLKVTDIGEASANAVSIVDNGGYYASNNVEDALQETAQSQNIVYTPAGTGAVQTSVQSKLRETVSVKDFGAIGDSVNGDDATLQAAIDYLHNITTDSGGGGTIEFSGTLYLAAPIKFGKNIRLIGKGRSFKSTIKPLASFSGSYLFGIDGDECVGGFAFRVRHEGFTIDNSLIATKAQLAKTYYINKAYDVALRDVWVYNARGTGIEVGASNLILIEDCSLYGVSASSTNAEYGVRVISGGSGAGGGGVKLINPDIEVWFIGFSNETSGRSQLTNPYFERNIIGWQSINSSGDLTVIGGEIESPGASGVAAKIYGVNTTVIGGVYTANGGIGLYVDPTSRKENVKILGASGDITDNKNYAYKENAAPSNWIESSVTNYKVVSDEVDTTFYTIVCPHLSSFFGVCEVTINARDASGYSLWTGKYRFAFSNPDGTVRLTPVVEHGKTNVNISANYALSLTTSATASGTTISFKINANSGGALGNGTSPRISTKAELVSWDSTGAIYLQAS
jgi:hypothetical protein